MSPHDPPGGDGTIRIVSLRGSSPDAAPVLPARGLTVLVGLRETDVDLLRGTFAALTGAVDPGLEARVEFDGSVVGLERGFAATHGLLGIPAPVVEVPGSFGEPGAGAAGQASSAPAAVEHLVELAARERVLVSELELARRELARERERLSEPAQSPEAGGAGDDPSGSPGAAELHPGDVAVMCDRLRELLAAGVPPRVDELVALLEAVARDRIHALYRSEALEQLIAECRGAIESARGFLGAEAEDGVVGEDLVVGEGVVVREEAVAVEDEEGGGRTDRGLVAHTIARLELLEELEGFWQERRLELQERSVRVPELVAEADEVLRGAGRDSVSTPEAALLSLRELAGRADREREAVDELAEQLAAWLGPPTGGQRHHARRREPWEVLELAEQRLAGVASVPGDASGDAAGRRPDPQLVAELEGIEARLGERLAAIRRELAAIERGLLLEQGPPEPERQRSDAVPNPFAQRSATPAAGRSAGRPRWSLATELRARRAAPGGVTLPVLVVEPMGVPNALADADPLAVAAMARSGQILWVTDRPGVTSALAVLGDEVAVVGA